MKAYIFSIALLFQFSLCISQYSLNDYERRFKEKFYYGRPCDGILYLDTVYHLFPSDSVLRTRGWLKLQCQDFKGATDDFSEAFSFVNTSDDSAVLYLNRAISKLRYNRTGALEDYTFSIVINPKIGGYKWRGGMFQSDKNYSAALQDYNKHIEIILGDTATGNYEIYWFRAEVKYQLKDFTGALADCDNALRLEPLCGECYKLRATIARETGKHSCYDYEKAVYWGYPEFEELILKFCK